MARPLRVDTSTTPDSLREISDGELAHCADLILDQFVSSNTGTGCLFVNPANTTGLTLIGTFTDTERPFNIGDHPVNTSVTTITWSFYQDQRTITNAPTARPLEYSTAALREQTDGEISAYIGNTALATLISSGQGTYRLQSAAPSPGTWISIASIKDEITGTSNTEYTLWRRTDGATSSSNRPVKVDTASNPDSIREMSDSEIQELNTYFRNRIPSTSVGTYLLQEATPTPGTWVQMGTAVTDTRQTVASNNYNVFFAGFAGPTFAGLTIQPGTETIQTVSLWLRTA